MLTRTLVLAATALVALSAGAQAGTLQNGTWTPSCPTVGDAPEFSSKSPDAFNKSTKAVQAWQAQAQAYSTCLSNEAKTDQNAIVTSANGTIQKLSDQLKALGDAQTAAVEKLKKQGGSSR